jgi:hypothetical protein
MVAYDIDRRCSHDLINEAADEVEGDLLCADVIKRINGR